MRPPSPPRRSQAEEKAEAPKRPPTEETAASPSPGRRPAPRAKERTLDAKLASWMRMAKSARASGADALAKGYIERVIRREAPADSPLRGEAKGMLDEMGG